MDGCAGQPKPKKKKILLEGMDVHLVFVVCCVGRGLCDGPITRPEESYCVCDLKTSKMRRPRPELGCWAREEKYFFSFFCRRTEVAGNC